MVCLGIHQRQHTSLSNSKLHDQWRGYLQTQTPQGSYSVENQNLNSTHHRKFTKYIASTIGICVTSVVKTTVISLQL